MLVESALESQNLWVTRVCEGFYSAMSSHLDRIVGASFEQLCNA